MAKTLFSLGKIYPSDFLKPDEQPRSEPIELKLIMDENGLVFLNETPEPSLMWGEKYFYRSSTSNTMRDQLKDVVDNVLKVIKVEDGDLWIDIGGNDAYMLSQVPSNLCRVNIDPANDSFRFDAEKNCDLVIQDYFSAIIFNKSKYGLKKAKVITCISMFYDILDADKFLKDVFQVLSDSGVFCLQISYTPLMLKQLEFSNLCHEHKYYYSLFNIMPLLKRNGFSVVDVSLNNTNAGSFRIFSTKYFADEKVFGSQTYRDVCQFRIESLLVYEKTLGLDLPETWFNFYDRINVLKKEVVDFVKMEKSKGKIIYGYGASTKGATILSYFGLDKDYITAIADRSPYKHGLRTVGTDIPIVSEDEMRAVQPDYLFVMPFHFINEFIEREQTYLKNGGFFIVPLPSFKIIGYES